MKSGTVYRALNFRGEEGRMRRGELIYFCSHLIGIVITLREVCAFCFPSRRSLRLPTALPTGQGARFTGETETLQELYSIAREIRTLQGHDAACPYYQEILNANPSDRTAGTRLAASPLTNIRHEQACEGSRERILDARELLQRIHYSHDTVSQFFGIQPLQELSCQGPLFLSPAKPGSVSTVHNYPLSDGKDKPSALACWISLFLLSLAVPKQWLAHALGEDSVQLIQDLGWAFPCSIDPSLIIPYVHIFPLDFDKVEALWFVTDLHPRVLSTTSLGIHGTTGNTVMYIGPDSLALPQHFHPYSQFLLNKPDRELRILDLGTGSGIQALSALKLASKATNQSMNMQVVAVDINPRALRFTKFNAVLNGLDDHLTLVHADLVSGLCRDNKDCSLEQRFEELQFHVILGNPPFLPVPSDTRGDDQTDSADHPKEDSTTLDSIDRRYGLFSSGGASGELLLKRMVEIASRKLTEGGYLGIVSEFFLQSHDAHFERFGRWWKDGQPGKMQASGNGVLFLNEYPIDAETYASRRADNPREKETWCQHLKSLNITCASPGLLYIKKGGSAGNGCLDLAISKVPKTQMGSVWTPSNLEAISFTQSICNEFWGWEKKDKQ